MLGGGPVTEAVLRRQKPLMERINSIEDYLKL